MGISEVLVEFNGNTRDKKGLGWYGNNRRLYNFSMETVMIESLFIIYSGV
jgi:hypothetical protein